MVFANVFAAVLECVWVEKVRALSRVLEQREAGSRKETNSMLALKRGAHTFKRTSIRTYAHKYELASPHSSHICILPAESRYLHVGNTATQNLHRMASGYGV